MLRFLSAGESHGPALMAILDGVPAGLPLQPAIIDHELGRRQRGYGSGARMKIEHDRVQLIGGVMGGETTGGPIAFLLENEEHARWKGKQVRPMTIPRPGHADLVGAIKYSYHDLRPALERASARETAMRVAVGAVCKHLLGQFGICIGGYVAAIGEVRPQLADMPYLERFERAELSDVRCPDDAGTAAMQAAIEAAMQAKDTLGGIVEIVAVDVPPGLGSFAQWDKRLEARLAMAAMSVQAIKGVEIGDAFANAALKGTLAQDAIRTDQAAILRPSNRAGGTEAGISNGQPIVLRAAMKPIATTLTPQQSVDLAARVAAGTQYERSDFCPVPRAVPILEAMVAFVLADALLEKLGGDSLQEIRPRYEALCRGTLEELRMDNVERIWWD